MIIFDYRCTNVRHFDLLNCSDQRINNNKNWYQLIRRDFVVFVYIKISYGAVPGNSCAKLLPVERVLLSPQPSGLWIMIFLFGHVFEFLVELGECCLSFGGVISNQRLQGAVCSPQPRYRSHVESASLQRGTRQRKSNPFRPLSMFISNYHHQIISRRDEAKPHYPVGDDEMLKHPATRGLLMSH